jgi:hypothetical protein
MISQFLLPETVARHDGTGPELAIGSGRSLLVTLGINRVVEQQSLDITIWGSPDGETWRQLAAFPQKFYCGTYALFVDVKSTPATKFVRAQWKVSRWGRGELTPLFGFYLFAEEANVMAAAH